ncbi:MAG: DUF1848 domain-containing protein [Alphaproteobacteria bacterium]|nr:DUF1848 domain-containing protein [Alphaproteobacteria bacterium]
MIVSVSYRTDIPAFHGTWFMNRLRAGFCRVTNPYGGKESTVSLAPADVDGFVFWTRNAGPFLPALDQIKARGFPFVVQFTITAYPRALEASVIEAERAVAQLRDLRDRFGARAAIWRYDPIAISSLTPTDWHRANFARLARSLAGAIDEVVVSFVQVYRKTRRNLDAAARRHGFSWRDPSIEEKSALLLRLAGCAKDHGMTLTLCTQPALARPDVPSARCIDATRLSDISGYAIAAPQQGNRPGCGCARSRDIGAYDTCPHGCVYCYAVQSPTLARKHFKGHNAGAERL